MSKFPLQLPHSAMMDGPNLIHNSNTRRVGGSSAQIGQTMMERPNLIHIPIQGGLVVVVLEWSDNYGQT